MACLVSDCATYNDKGVGDALPGSACGCEVTFLLSIDGLGEATGNSLTAEDVAQELIQKAHDGFAYEAMAPAQLDCGPAPTTANLLSFCTSFAYSSASALAMPTPPDPTAACGCEVNFLLSPNFARSGSGGAYSPQSLAVMFNWVVGMGDTNSTSSFLDDFSSAQAACPGDTPTP